jgi:hypothetical protein
VEWAVVPIDLYDLMVFREWKKQLKTGFYAIWRKNYWLMYNSVNNKIK